MIVVIWMATVEGKPLFFYPPVVWVNRERAGNKIRDNGNIFGMEPALFSEQ